MHIFILAGGFGTRLKSVLSDLPKPMAPVEGKPFLSYQIEMIRRSFPGTTVYLLTHHLSECIERFFSDAKGVVVVKEEEALGTGGSVRHAVEMLGLPDDETLLVLNGDTYVEADLKDFINEASEEVMLLASLQKNCDRYGTLEIKDDMLVDFKEKHPGYTNKYINAGIYYFRNTRFFTEGTSGVFSLEERLKSHLLSSRIGVSSYEGVFIDIGIPSDYRKMQDYIKERNVDEE